MAKVIFLIVCLISAFGGPSTSTDIECRYGMPDAWGVLGTIYICDVTNDPNILTQQSAQISGISGSHGSSKNNDDVLGIRVNSKTIQYFPRGLEKFFKNLKGIHLGSCELKEVHQSDLKSLPNLVYFSLEYNAIEVVERGLFDFNPNLELVRLEETKIIHIDANVFDHLSKLRYFLLSSVPCAKQIISDSISRVKDAIKVVKSKCSNSDVLSLDEQIKNLEIESKTLNSEDFNTKLESFEKSLRNSKFSDFRPFNHKLESLKSEKCSNCRQLIKIESIHSKIDNLSEKISSDLKNMKSFLEDQNLAQCEIKSPFDELKTSQNALQTTLSGIKSSITDHGSKIDQIQNSQNQIKDSMTSSINSVSSKVNDLSQAQNVMKNSISQIEVKIDDLKSSQTGSLSAIGAQFSVVENQLKNHGAVLSDIETTLSDNKKFQTEAKDSLIKVRATQNEIKMALNEISTNRNDNSEDKLSLLSDKLESLEGHFMELSERFDKNEKENANTRHKISTNFDEKIKGIEKRLMKKFEEILEEKLGKILDEKLGNVIEARLRKE